MRGNALVGAGSRVVRHQHVGTKSVALRNRYIRRVVSVLGALLLVAIVFVWTRVRVIELGYEVTRLHHEVSLLQEQRADLSADVERLKAPARLEKIARERFGMRQPYGHEIIFVNRK